MTDFVMVPPNDLANLIKKAVQEAIDEDRKDRDSDKLLNAKELCQLLGIHLSTLNTWKAESKIPFKRLGKRIFFNKNEVLDSLEDSNYYRIKELKQ